MERRIAGIEAASARIRAFQPCIVLGLAQTPAYMSRCSAPGVTSPGPSLDKAIAERVTRQGILDSGRDITLVMTEGALRWQAAGPALMTEQIDHLAEISYRVRLGVIPWTAPATVFPLHGFTIYDSREVTVGTLAATAFLTDPPDVADHEKLFAGAGGAGGLRRPGPRAPGPDRRRVPGAADGQLTLRPAASTGSPPERMGGPNPVPMAGRGETGTGQSPGQPAPRLGGCPPWRASRTARWMAVPGMMGGMGEKRCSQCGEVKPLAEFSRAAHGRDGRAAHCKECHNTLYRLPLDRVPVLTCLYCGKHFPNPAGRGPDRKFCSPHCKERWWREEYRPAPRGGTPEAMQAMQRAGGAQDRSSGLQRLPGG